MSVTAVPSNSKSVLNAELTLLCRGGYTLGMTTAANRIVSEALELPPPVRAFVAEKLIESLDMTPGGELTPKWREEIRRRCEEIDQGTVELRDAESVFARAFAA